MMTFAFKSRRSKAVAGFASSSIQYAVQIGLQALLAPAILKFAGRETLGAYAVLSQGLNYLALVDLGYAQPLERFLAQAHARDDGGRLFVSIFGTFRTFLWISNFVFALLVILYAFNVSHLYHLSGVIASQARTGLLLIAVWAFLRAPLIAYNCALQAVQEMTSMNLTMVILSTLRLTLSLTLVVLGFRLLGLMLAALAIEVVGSFTYRLLFLRKFPEYKRRARIRDRALFKHIISFGSHTSFLQFATLVSFNSGNLLVGYLLGVGAVSVYYTAQMPCQLLYNLIFRISDNAGPALNELWAKGNFAAVRDTYVRLMRYSVLCGLLLGVGLLLFGKLLTTVWVGIQQYAGIAAMGALAVLAITVAIDHVNGVLAVVVGEVKLMSRITLLQTILSAGLGILLGHFFGIAGVIASCPLAVLPRAILMTRRIHTVLSLNSKQFQHTAGESIKLLIAPIAITGIVLTAVRSTPPAVQFSSGMAVFVGMVAVFISRSALLHEEAAYVMSFVQARVRAVLA